VDINRVLSGDLKSCLQALSLLSAHGSNLVYFVDFFQDFVSLAATLTEYMSFCYGKIESFHEKLIPEMIDRSMRKISGTSRLSIVCKKSTTT
jgi:hypothetical protein